MIVIHSAQIIFLCGSQKMKFCIVKNHYFLQYKTLYGCPIRIIYCYPFNCKVGMIDCTQARISIGYDDQNNTILGI